VVVGIGGGSVIDSAKAIAALAPNKGELTDYLEVIGKGQKTGESAASFYSNPHHSRNRR
jgi:alcohol dehydrogenase class IV